MKLRLYNHRLRGVTRNCGMTPEFLLEVRDLKIKLNTLAGDLSDPEEVNDPVAGNRVGRVAESLDRLINFCQKERR